MTDKKVTKRSVLSNLRGLRKQHPFSELHLTAAIEWIDRYVPNDETFENKKSRPHKSETAKYNDSSEIISDSGGFDNGNG